MREIWREICEGIDVRILLLTLLSIALILFLSFVFMSTLLREEDVKLQQESSIALLNINPVQTNFTS